jgi:transcriptional regulator of acetoin/glycerol metabolism
MTGAAAPQLIALVRQALETGVGRDYAWPGNVRELEQAVRRILLTRRYEPGAKAAIQDARDELVAGMDGGTLDADAVLARYCALLHRRHGTFEAVARRTNLDRRTVKKYLKQAADF